MSTKLRTLLLAAPLLVLALSAFAEGVAPDVLIKSVAAEVTAAIKADPAIRAGDSRRISDLVEAKILPHFDFRRATQAAMGPNWRRATPDQQEQLAREFKTLVLRTYSGALASYRDQAIEFRPLRSQPVDGEVTVRSLIRQPGAESIVVEYDMAQTEAGWKVFDIRVAGISLVATYRSAFSEEVRNHGVEGLIELLSTKNRQAVKTLARS